jgi:lipopolysaccharide transport system permease protein
MEQISEVYKARDLIIAWTSRTVRARYQQSILGWLWAVVQPTASVVIFAIIFTYFIPVDTGDTPYVVFAYVGMVPWTLLSSSVLDMTTSLVQNMSLVTKIYFPREVIPIATMLARFLDFIVASGLVVVLVLLYRVYISFPTWLFLPLIILVQLMLILGLGLLGSALNVFTRDIEPLVRLGLQLWFYASPVIYPIAMVPAEWRNIYFLNPMAGILEAYRAVIVHNKAPDSSLAIAGAISGLILVIGLTVFNRVEHLFADIV